MKSLNNVELRQRLARVKLLALDVDGVLTDGGLYYTETGEELKKFNVKDGMGLKRLMGSGVETAIITTSESPSVTHRARKLGILHVFLGAEDKLETLEQLCQKLELRLDEVAYVGDDINDIPVLKSVGCPLTIADAIPENMNYALYVTQKAGGKGAVREICDLIISAKGS
jgi:3-deoxy-D-manno-octulosonate 8-phosphate phosphatase (KDO 8-P phosphatase)